METMNISESLMFVLKNRSGDLFKSFWKSDLKSVFRDVKTDLEDVIKSSTGKIKEIKNQSIKETLVDLKDSTVDSVTVFKVVPSRIRQGLIYFQQDLLDELGKLPEQKQKTLFSLKVIGILSSFTLNALYGVRRAKSDLQFRGLRVKNAMTQMIATELLVRISQVFTLRLINEIEKQMNDEDELRKLSYFKSLLANPGAAENQPELASEFENTDRAYLVVESLKTYMLTGKRIAP